MIGRPETTEAAAFHWKYIDQTIGDNPVLMLRSQLDETLELFSSITEEKSAHRYAPDKWSLRQTVNHITDTERVFAFRALWFARGLPGALPDYDQEIAVAGAEADRTEWRAHLHEWEQVRLGTIDLFTHLPPEAWLRTGIASGNSFTTRAMAFITIGHAAHHMRIVRERYLV